MPSPQEAKPRGAKFRVGRPGAGEEGKREELRKGAGLSAGASARGSRAQARWGFGVRWGMCDQGGAAGRRGGSLTEPTSPSAEPQIPQTVKKRRLAELAPQCPWLSCGWSVAVAFTGVPRKPWSVLRVAGFAAPPGTARRHSRQKGAGEGSICDPRRHTGGAEAGWP